MTPTAPLLLPAPRAATWTGGCCPIDAAVTSAADIALPTEGYRLSITRDGVRIDHADPAGRRHALATLAQLAAQGPLPCGTVEDHPAFAVRGLMLDISRDRVPTLPELRRLIAQLASWKMNHLELYCEHAIAYRGHEVVTGPADAIPLEELAGLGDEARAVGIILTPNQNCFAHLERWFRHPAYEPLAERPGDPGHHHRCGSRSLAPAVPGSLAFVTDLIGQLCATLAAPVFNIGGDETWDMGAGRSRSLVERDGYGTVYGRFLGSVMATVRAQGRRPSFWADILLNHPGSAGDLDREAIALDWGYGGHHDFDRSQQRLIDSGFASRWICPGTSCWSSWGGYSDERRANLLRAARAGLRHRASGFLVTCWGDGGHRQIWPASLAAIAEAAHRAWSGPDLAYDPMAGGLHAFGCPELGPWLDELGQLDRPLRDGARWETAYRAFHEPAARDDGRQWMTEGALKPHQSAASEWQGVIERALDLGRRLPDRIPDQIRDECRHALDLIVLGCERGRETCGGRQRDGHWSSRVARSIAEHRRLWLLRARNGGLDDSAATFLAPLG